MADSRAFEAEKKRNGYQSKWAGRGRGMGWGRGEQVRSEGCEVGGAGSESDEVIGGGQNWAQPRSRLRWPRAALRSIDAMNRLCLLSRSRDPAIARSCLIWGEIRCRRGGSQDDICVLDEHPRAQAHVANSTCDA